MTPGRPTGVYLVPSRPSREGQVVFSEKIDSNLERSDYVKRPGDDQFILFYRHGRSIGPTLGHHRQLVLINDYAATQGCNVVIADLNTRKNWNIDSAATERYRTTANPDARLVIVPEAYGFSPSDREVLIGMDLVYISVPTAELADEVGRTYARCWYVVDSSSGRVLHEYRTNQPPSCWWIYGNE